MSDNQLKIKIQVNNQKANKSLKDTGKAVDNVGKKAKDSEKELGRMRVATAGLRRTMGALRNNLLLVTFAFGGTFAAIGKSVKAFGEQELAEKKLEAALGKTSDALLKQASALQQVTTFGDENIIQAQALIAAFTDDEEAIKRATAATLDLAAAKGMDLFAAADLVAKTLGSSTNAMSRYGIEVTGAVGSTERLNTLTQNIAKTFGGQATAQAETLTGSLTQMSNAVGDAAEAVGGLLAPAVMVTSNVIKSMAEELQRVINFHDNLARVAAMEVVGVLTTEQAAVSDLEHALKSMTRGDIIRRISALQNGLSVKAIEDQLPMLQNFFHSLEEGTLTFDQLNTGNIQLGAGFEHHFELLKRLIQAYEFAPTGLSAYDEKLQEFVTTQLTALSNYQQEQKLIADFTKMYPEQAKALGLVTDEEKKLKQARKDTAKEFINNMQVMGKTFPEMEKAAKRAAQVQALVDAYASANAAYKAMAGIPVVGPTLGVGAYTAALGKGLASVKQIEAAETGMDQIIDKPTLILAGENNKAESVQITPLEGPNVNGPQNTSNNVTVNVSGNVMSKDFVEGELAENIKDAIRRGADFGLS